MQTVFGQVSKISSTSDNCIRLFVDIDKDAAPDDIFKWLFETVMLSKDETKEA